MRKVEVVIVTERLAADPRFRAWDKYRLTGGRWVVTAPYDLDAWLERSLTWLVRGPFFGGLRYEHEHARGAAIASWLERNDVSSALVLHAENERAPDISGCRATVRVEAVTL